MWKQRGKKEADVTRVLETELVWDAARGEGSRIWEKLSQTSMRDLHPQLRKQWKLKISRVWSHSVLSPGCSKIRPVLQTRLQLPQEAQAACASLARLLLIIKGRRSQAGGSPVPQRRHGGQSLAICDDQTEQGWSSANVVIISPHRGFFFFFPRQAIRLFGKPEMASRNKLPSMMLLLETLSRAHRGVSGRKSPSWRNHKPGPAGRWKMRPIFLHDLTLSLASGRILVSASSAPLHLQA